MENLKNDNDSINYLNSQLLKNATFSFPHEFPILNKVDFKPANFIPYGKAKSPDDYNQWVHFYMYDSKFSGLWNNPQNYLSALKRFEGVITPDYSVYYDMPLCIQTWNTFRNRTLAYWLQNNGVPIIPNIRWGDERSYDFAFEGIEEGGTVSIGSHGNIKKRVNAYYFEKGLEIMIEKLKPETIVCVGAMPDKIFKRYADSGIHLIRFPSEIEKIFKNRRV